MTRRRPSTATSPSQPSQSHASVPGLDCGHGEQSGQSCDLTALILTFNEEKHLDRCIRSLLPVCSNIVIIDSFSTDRTLEIASNAGAQVLQHAWSNNYAAQLNWGIRNAPLSTRWVMRLDADEYLTPELQQEIHSKLPELCEQISGVRVKRRVIHKGKWIKYGGYYPIWLLRIWKNGLGSCESRLMDEHMIVSEGRVTDFQHDLVDENLNDIFWWTSKHNGYARREAADLMNIKYRIFATTNRSGQVGNQQSLRKRWIKERIYSKLPIGVRAFAYFAFRFTLQRAFMDSPKVWIFHFLQGLWYRILVDLNVAEFEKNVGIAPLEAKKRFLATTWNIPIDDD